MRLLILGVNGFLGRAIGRIAGQDGITVFGLSRSPRPEVGGGVRYLQGDRSETDEVDRLIANHGIDTVVDVIAYTRQGTAPLLEVLDNNITQYVLLSSCDVYKNFGLIQRLETGEPVSWIDESSPLRESRFPYRQDRADDDPQLWMNDYDKIPIEEDVSTLSLHWTILRLPMIYGPGDRQHRFAWAISPMAEGEPGLRIPTPWANWVSTYSYIDDVARGVVLTLGHEAAFNRIYNIGEAEPRNHLSWVNRIADVMGWAGEVDMVDDPDHPLSLSTAHLDLTVNLAVDSTAIRKSLGYSEGDTIETYLSATINSEASTA